MKRPEKKECSDENPYNCLECGDEGWVYGYNQACDDWEKWTEKCQEDFISVSSLPSCKELEEIIDTLTSEKSIFNLEIVTIKGKCFNKITMNKNGKEVLAKAIHRRLNHK